MIPKLPRLPEDLEVIILRSSQVSSANYRTFSVNRKRFAKFCHWAKRKIEQLPVDSVTKHLVMMQKKVMKIKTLIYQATQ